MQNCDNLKRARPGPIDNGVIGISSQRPETKRTSGEVRSGMAAQRVFSHKRASFVDGLFYAVGGGFAIPRNVTPDVNDIFFCKRSERTRAHRQVLRKRLDKRQSSFIA
jgi:hypothetical protein